MNHIQCAGPVDNLRSGNCFNFTLLAQEKKMVQPQSSILFASDLSVNMQAVFEQAATLAINQNASVVVLHVMEEHPRSEKRIRMAFGEALYKDLKNEQKQGARDILSGKNVDAMKIKKAISGFFETNSENGNSDNLIEKILVSEGRSIADEIAGTALQENCSTIVMGCRQRGLLADAMGDHIVRKVLKRSPVPVLVVPFKKG